MRSVRYTSYATNKKIKALVKYIGFAKLVNKKLSNTNICNELPTQFGANLYPKGVLKLSLVARGSSVGLRLRELDQSFKIETI